MLLRLGSVIDRAVNARAMALAESIRSANVPGVRDVVPTFCAVAVHFDPTTTRLEALWSTLAAEPPAGAGRMGRLIEIPACYGGEYGPDLADVARAAGVSEREVVSLHAGRDYHAFMLGFMPGFPYLGVLDPRLQTPRLETPRVRVAAGSIGIAARQTGVYPFEAPGGWRIVGRTGVTLFDPGATPPALVAPGDCVRFVPVDAVAGPAAAMPPAAASEGHRAVTVLDAGLFSTVQDLGRWGWQAQGVPVSGALDWFSHRLANRLVGNTDQAATLEITITGPTLRMESDAIVATCGADLAGTVDGARLAPATRTRIRAGGVLRFGRRTRGARSYIAVEGGFDVPPVLGSRATHVPSHLGGWRGRALREGDRLPVGRSGGALPRLDRVSVRPFGVDAEPARLRILPGPDARAHEDALSRLVDGRFTVTPESSRMGLRLSGAAPLTSGSHGDAISGPTFAGAIQVSGAGDPMLLLSDRQTTGGYPQIAVVISADLLRAAQLLPGDRVAFALCTHADAAAALLAEESRLLAVQ